MSIITKNHKNRPLLVEKSYWKRPVFCMNPCINIRQNQERSDIITYIASFPYNRVLYLSILKKANMNYIIFGL